MDYNYIYHTVSNDRDAQKQSSDLIAFLRDGWEIISAAGNGFSVHYVLRKYVGAIVPKVLPTKEPRP